MIQEGIETSKSFGFLYSQGVLIVGLAILFLTPRSVLLFGQALAATASPSGFVVVPLRSRVAGAADAPVRPERGTTRTLETGPSGTFSFTLLPPAVYRMGVNAARFKAFVQNNLTFEVGQAGTLDATLTLGNTTTQVTVSSEAALFNTNNANLGSKITCKQVVDLPLNVRIPVALTYLHSSAKFLDAGHLGGGVDMADQDNPIVDFSRQFSGSTLFC